MTRTIPLVTLGFGVLALWFSPTSVHAFDKDSSQTILVYRFAGKHAKAVDERKIKQLVKAVSNRLRATKIPASVQHLGTDRLEVAVNTTKKESLERVKALIARKGTLEFSILANRKDHANIIAKANDVKRDLRDKDQLIAGWREVSLDREGKPNAIGDFGQVVFRENKQTHRKEFLIVFAPPKERVTGDYLTRAYETIDTNDRFAMGLEFSILGGLRVRNLTSNNKPDPDGFARRLGILLDDQIHSAPKILTTISRHAQITGNFSEQDVVDLVSALNTGPLPIPLVDPPVSETIKLKADK